MRFSSMTKEQALDIVSELMDLNEYVSSSFEAKVGKHQLFGKVLVVMGAFDEALCIALELPAS